MKKPEKTSRNKSRKARYAAMADGRSRNQDTVPKMNCQTCHGVVGLSCIVCCGTGSVPWSKAEESR